MEPTLPRVAITYCTQCKWMLRAAYFAQELLSTFGTTIGEIALIPATGGIFTVSLTYKREGSAEGPKDEAQATTVLLWDRKEEGGFPETKILKQRVRDHLDPKRSLGHSDTPAKSSKQAAGTVATEEKAAGLEKNSRVEAGVVLRADGTVCEDCNP
ncbi:uncharacterized protein PV09_06050 [Verruconis gallopava]|uniref:Selenoprotein W-like protein n=1 Tax=Verruconis gallopava TaxID=253628 RepID=A0A0D1XJX4_9PEZI|nr:uncharacterized protein PV09_06050 [Verruconis gallopava]KIW02601.1 hypothetical protein PV09_06050 [Verruconis gallopava]